MSLMATERIPQPMAVVGVVSPIGPERTLVVRISDTASGYERLTWKTAYQALKRSEEGGWRTADPTVYASTDKAERVAHATAGDPVFGGLLKFRFNDDSAYFQLVGEPGLTAFVVLDRGSHRLLGCKFRNAKR